VVLCFARALGEFGATITFAGNIAGETRTLPLLIHTELQTPGGELRLGPLIAISVAISFVALLLSELGARRVRRARTEGGAR
jgi:molybdate transport system permease protein